jgi:hypothetical protein
MSDLLGTKGLRRRVGLRAWPILRNGEADLSGQISRVLGPGRFSEMTLAGSRLSRQEAVAAVSRRALLDSRFARGKVSAS